MEERNVKVIVNKAGGNASTNSNKYILNIPAIWAQQMGFTPEERDILMTFDGEQIIIKKNKCINNANIEADASSVIGLGNRIKFYREMRGLTQKQLSQLVGISLSSIKSYEAGDREPKSAVMQRIADVLDVTTEDLCE